MAASVTCAHPKGGIYIEIVMTKNTPVEKFLTLIQKLTDINDKKLIKGTIEEAIINNTPLRTCCCNTAEKKRLISLLYKKLEEIQECEISTMFMKTNKKYHNIW